VKRCKHENTAHMMPGDSSTPDWHFQLYAKCEQVRCIECGAWLPFDPAVDDGPMLTPEVREAVAIEIRAAEIAQLSSESPHKSWPQLGVTDSEIDGAFIAKHDQRLGCLGDDEHAGYLAVIICEHGEDAQ